VLAIKRRERDRRLAAERKRAHGELANPILEQGTTIKSEKLSYQSFQKNFGRSVKLRAPGMLVSTLRRKAEGAGGGVVEINTRQTRLSQFDHTTGEYIKKPLS
jgi:putative transposase